LLIEIYAGNSRTSRRYLELPLEFWNFLSSIAVIVEWSCLSTAQPACNSLKQFMEPSYLTDELRRNGNVFSQGVVITKMYTSVITEMWALLERRLHGLTGNRAKHVVPSRPMT